MRRAAASGDLTNNAFTAVLVDTIDYNKGGMADTTNNRINILRPGIYGCNAVCQLDGASGTGQITFFGPSIYKNASTALADIGVSQDAGTYVAVGVSCTSELVAGDFVRLRVYHGTAGTNYDLLVTSPNFIEVTELPQW
jgi:hypothetical protein